MKKRGRGELGEELVQAMGDQTGSVSIGALSAQILATLG